MKTSLRDLIQSMSKLSTQVLLKKTPVNVDVSFHDHMTENKVSIKG